MIPPFPVMQQPLVGQGLIVEASRSHSVGLVWMSDQPRPLRDNTQHSQQTDIHASGVNRNQNLSKPTRSQTHAFDRAATVSSPEIILILT